MNTYTMTKIGLVQFVFLFLISAAYGQKVKYKDIYALLSTKQFEQAEPFLKLYLKETTDNPNAYLYMANIYQEKSSRDDILKHTALALGHMDSAIFFYDKAHKTIDDREVRKNKEYYQHYNRRDLRTGEFGIKLSDIQFDIEKRIEALRERITNVKMIKHFFSLADSLYRIGNAQYVSLQNHYPTLHQFYLRATDKTAKELTAMSQQFDSCVYAFRQYKTAITNLGKTGYNQKITISDISDFKLDGRSGADFYADEVTLWNYKKFADEARTIIEKEVMPMRAHLVNYHKEINALSEKLVRDSVSVRNDLTKLIDKILYDQLTKFDPQPLPMIVFGMKTTDMEYRSVLLEHKSLRDSSDLHFQVRLLSEELGLLKQLDSIAAILPEGKLDEKIVDYSDFVNNTFSNSAALKEYLKEIRNFSIQEQEKHTVTLERYLKGLNFIVDGSDSIPLVSDVRSVFRPLTTMQENFTTGLTLQDSTQLKGYFYTIASSRLPEVKAYFPVDKSAFSAGTVSAARAIAYSDASGQIFYVLIYSENAVKDKIPATLAKIYRSDGLAWTSNYSLGFLPGELVFKTDTGDLVIGNGENEFVVDKNGKIVSAQR